MTRKPPKVSDKERFFNKFSNDKEAMAIVDYLEKTKEPVTFIHGKAGTGKSIFLQSYYDYAESKGDNIIKLAPTGLAARNIEGQTISSFFGFDWRPLKRNDPSIYKQRISLKPMIQTVDTIIIDEISMVRSDLIDAIDTSLRHNSKQKNKPFGGKRIIFFGDIFQLEPVLEKKEEELFTDFGYDHKDFFFFKAKVFKEYSIDIEIRELTKAYRHNQDKEFLDILDKIRIGNDTDLEKINSRIQKTNNKDSLKQTTLCTKTKIADKYNNENLSRLPGDLFKNTGIVKDNYPKKELPTEEELALKIEAKVIFVKNDSLGRWVNGSIGYISNVQKESKSTSLKSISVKLEDDNKEVIVRPVVFENMRYYFDEESKSILSEIEGTFTQFPMKLGWALTIHKSQGLEFKNIAIDRGTGMFAHGQLYVALSRCQSLKGIKLKSKIKKSDVVVKPSAINFINQNKSEKIKEDWRPIDLYGDEDEPQINNNNEEGGDFVLSEEYEVWCEEIIADLELVEKIKSFADAMLASGKITKGDHLKVLEGSMEDQIVFYKMTYAARAELAQKPVKKKVANSSRSIRGFSFYFSWIWKSLALTFIIFIFLGIFGIYIYYNIYPFIFLWLIIYLFALNID